MRRLEKFLNEGRLPVSMFLCSTTSCREGGRAGGMVPERPLFEAVNAVRLVRVDIVTGIDPLR